MHTPCTPVTHPHWLAHRLHLCLSSPSQPAPLAAFFFPATLFLVFSSSFFPATFSPPHPPPHHATSSHRIQFALETLRASNPPCVALSFFFCLLGLSSHGAQLCAIASADYVSPLRSVLLITYATLLFASPSHSRQSIIHRIPTAAELAFLKPLAADRRLISLHHPQRQDPYCAPLKKPNAQIRITNLLRSKHVHVPSSRHACRPSRQLGSPQ